jgi:hypothetical protein
MRAAALGTQAAVGPAVNFGSPRTHGEPGRRREKYCVIEEGRTMRSRTFAISFVSTVVVLAACASRAPQEEAPAAASEGALAGAATRGLRIRTSTRAKPEAPKPITYHGGPVMHGTTNIYYIWYGNWAGNSAVTILTDLANDIGGSQYFAINTTYGDGSGKVSNAVHYAGSTNDAYSHGTSLDEAAVRDVVSGAISSHSLPLDASGIYFVLTSDDVKQSLFCSPYCGWHNAATISGTDVKYAHVGNAATLCPASCIESGSGANGNAGADGMASVLVHELEEAATDPDLNAWYDSDGEENADKCAWTWGKEYTSANGSRANVRLGARDFLIQQNWVNAGAGYCSMEGPGGIFAAEGAVSLLRANDVGTGYGPPEDFIDAEIIVQLDSEPGRGFGFQLRADGEESARRGMLKLLRDSFRTHRRVHVEYEKNGPANGRVVRVQPAP